MPLVPFDSLPGDARVWVFGAAADIDEPDEQKLLLAVDGFLTSWQAHGQPLTCGRDWRAGRFLAVGVDQRSEGASGCSIDGLFRTLKGLEPAIGTSLVGGGQVFFRDAIGLVHAVTRKEFERLAVAHEISADTAVFDITVTSAGAYRSSFEVPAGASWHRALLATG